MRQGGSERGNDSQIAHMLHFCFCSAHVSVTLKGFTSSPANHCHMAGEASTCQYVQQNQQTSSTCKTQSHLKLQPAQCRLCNNSLPVLHGAHHDEHSSPQSESAWCSCTERIRLVLIIMSAHHDDAQRDHHDAQSPYPCLFIPLIVMDCVTYQVTVVTVLIRSVTY